MLVAVMLAVLAVLVDLLDVEGVRHREDTLSTCQLREGTPALCLIGVMVVPMRVRVLQLGEATKAVTATAAS